MSNFLMTIKQKIKDRIEVLDINKLRQASQQARQPHNFLMPFIYPKYPFPIIAEIKFASPSAGVLLAETDPIAIAKAYLNNGASALSILTEPEFFHGDILFLQKVREAFPDAYLLMKDFVLHEAQLLQARVFGADAVLLIVAFLSAAELQTLYHKALELQLTPLIEVHTAAELDSALKLQPKLIGINNRDLQSLKIDLDHSLELIKHMPADCIAISESGLTQPQQLQQLRQLGFQGFLIGSYFMKTGDPGRALKNLLTGINN